ncbi:MAG: chaperone modulator CbpM [Desulfobulbaceae bacterium]|nr:chaperone modulator CbpM [Desulfobulbaceae bacterium]
MVKDIIVISGEVLDRHRVYSLYELCSLCRASAEAICDMVEEGIVEPFDGREPHEWIFIGTDVYRIKLALRLQKDLKVNLPGAALAIELIEELNELKRRFRHFK